MKFYKGKNFEIFLIYSCILPWNPDSFGKLFLSSDFQICYLPIEKHLEMPYWNLLCLRRIGLLAYVCSVSKNIITKPYAKKLDRILVNDDKIVN